MQGDNRELSKLFIGQCPLTHFICRGSHEITGRKQLTRTRAQGQCKWVVLVVILEGGRNIIFSFLPES